LGKVRITSLENIKMTQMENTTYEINRKEDLYFAIRLTISGIVYLLLLLMLFSLATLPMAGVGILTVFFCAGLIALLFIIRSGILVGYIKGNAVKITKTQFPDIYAILEKQCEKLNIGIPSSYILQSGGILNAFATKFLGRNYVVLYSEIVELAYERGQEALEFVIAHELGHVRRNHMTKRLLLFPSAIIPFLGSAYSRACEYTCDNIGKSLSPNGAMKGLLILAAGKHLYSKVNVAEYVINEQHEAGFWKWFAEKISSHPHLPKRLNNLGISTSVIQKETEKELAKQISERENNSRFMPGQLHP
jgi:Zn-dependent protease with chaperone function